MPRRYARRSSIAEGKRVNQLTDSEVLQIREVIDRDYVVEGDLSREVSVNIKRLIDLSSYRGLASPQGSAGARSAHPYQRAHPQGAGQGDRRQEEVVRHSRDRNGKEPEAAPRNLAPPRPGGSPQGAEEHHVGVVHVMASFNNTMITITDVQGNTISWASAGKLGFKGSRKSTPYAAQVAADQAGRAAIEHGMKWSKSRSAAPAPVGNRL